MKTFTFGISLLLVAISFANGKPTSDVGFGYRFDPTSNDETALKEWASMLDEIFSSTSTPESVDLEVKLSDSRVMMILRDKKTQKLTEKDFKELQALIEKGVAVDVSQKDPHGWEKYTKPNSADSSASNLPPGLSVQNYIKKSATGPILVIVGS